MATNILMPALSPTMEEGTLSRWLVKEGDKVTSGTVIAEIETDKATMEFEAVDEGTVARLVVAEGTQGVKVNDLIAVLVEEGESLGELEAPRTETFAKSTSAAPTHSASREVAASPPQGTVGGDRRIFASPLARRIALERGLDLRSIDGTGPGGRIVRTDVEAARPKEVAAGGASTVTKAATPSPPAPTTSQAEAIKKVYRNRPYEEVRLDGMRSTIATRLAEAKQTIPHFYLRREVRLDRLLSFRSKLNMELAARNVKLSVNDFVIKACACALQQVPECNVAWAGDRILRFSRSDVAVAVAVEGGLFTPVIRDADLKSITALSAEMKELADRAKTRRLAPHEYQGGSFAISNLGMMGVESFDAVINPPQASILAVGAGVKRPVVAESGEIVVETVMSLTLSVDHRAIDGALGATFLAAVKDSLENPLVMLA